MTPANLLLKSRDPTLACRSGQNIDTKYFEPFEPLEVLLGKNLNPTRKQIAQMEGCATSTRQRLSRYSMYSTPPILPDHSI